MKKMKDMTLVEVCETLIKIRQAGGVLVHDDRIPEFPGIVYKDYIQQCGVICVTAWEAPSVPGPENLVKEVDETTDIVSIPTVDLKIFPIKNPCGKTIALEEDKAVLCDDDSYSDYESAREVRFRIYI